MEPLERWMLVKEGTCPGDWTMDTLEGTSFVVYEKHGKVVYLSTRNVPDSDRTSKIPSLEVWRDSLLVLDLHKSRYLREVDASICNITTLTHLLLTRCSNLKSLPDSIGNLTSLTEVSCVVVMPRIVKCLYANPRGCLSKLNLFDSPQISELPPSIGTLKRYV